MFVGADHAPHFDAVADLLLREFESAFLFGCCAGGVIGGGREIEDRPGLSLTGALLPGVKFKGTHLDAAQVPAGVRRAAHLGRRAAHDRESATRRS